MTPGIVTRGLLAALIFLLPNALFLLAAWLGIGRPVINVDYAIPVLLAVLGWWRLGLLLGLLFVTIDVILLMMQVFPFIRLTDVFYFLNIAHLASPLYQLILAALVILPAVLVTVTVLFARRQNKLAGLVFLNACLLGYAWSIHMSPAVSENRLWRVMEQKSFGSAALYFYEYRFNGFIQGHLKDSVSFREAGFEGVLRARIDEPGADPLVLFVLNESWGAPVDHAIQQRLLAPLKELPLQGDSFYGEQEFFGATVAAELKELCDLRPDHFALKTVQTGFEACLPHRFAEAGYETHAVHGAMGVIYDRKDWYPRAGFDHLTLYESRPWPRRCRSFPGACDIDIAVEVRRIIEQGDQNKLVYWLTLNSHSLYDRRDLFVDVEECDLFGLAQYAESCRNVQLQQQFFKVLADIFAGYQGRPVRVVVVGDHVPPIIDQMEKDAVFQERTVPWVDFTVGDGEGAEESFVWLRALNAGPELSLTSGQ